MFFCFFGLFTINISNVEIQIAINMVWDLCFLNEKGPRVGLLSFGCEVGLNGKEINA
jgi:hypothetical protein